MGLTFQSTQVNALKETYKINKEKNEYVIALAGNPNTGKSTVFNSLTGLHQHTGNWPGKTVTNAKGQFIYNGKKNIVVDLPGTYSLFASSVEEEVARDFICFGNSDVVVVVADATCLERNLALVYQVMELTKHVILCINLIDEAKKKNIIIDNKGIEKELGIPVVLCAARNNIGIPKLKKVIYDVTNKKIELSPNVVHYDSALENSVKSIQSAIGKNSLNINSRWLALRIIDGDKKITNSILNYTNEEKSKDILNIVNSLNSKRQNIRDIIQQQIYKYAETISNKYIICNKSKFNHDVKIDNYITSKLFGIPLMLLTLVLVFWITIVGANIPSSLLSNLFLKIETKLSLWLRSINTPPILYGIFIPGLYKTATWVISVMLPPMAIFFPIFTILEDLGYLPRIAFNLDHIFKKACAHGKQCLTMCMGFGCNAAGIISCRIIESPRERLIAILTNNFVPCNGRFPTLIAISSCFFIAASNSTSSLIPALSVAIMVIIGIVITLLVSYLLSKTLLKGIPSTFTLELPPYRVPQIGRVLYTSIIDRTIFVLWRAVIVAIPAGIITWLLSNIYIGNLSIVEHVATFLDPVAKLIGLDGFILMAFILALPANEIVLPILLMLYLSTGEMVELQSIQNLRTILINNGWTYLTALNFMLFSLLHWPCATTLLTIKKETGSNKWTFLSIFITLTVCFSVCFITTILYKLFYFVF